MYVITRIKIQHSIKTKANMYKTCLQINLFHQDLSDGSNLAYTCTYRRYIRHEVIKKLKYVKIHK